MQYIIEHYTEKIKVDSGTTDGQDMSKRTQAMAASQKLSVVKAQLFMEKEESFFLIDKGDRFGMMSNQAPSVRSVMMSRRRGSQSRFGASAAALSRTSSMSNRQSARNNTTH